MAKIDIAMASFDGFPGYVGNPPSTEEEFNATFGSGNSWVNKPTWQEVQNKLQEVNYKENRAAEYPSIGDQLDALWKGGEAAAEMLAKVQAVKAKYQKVGE
jgi:hypothetical protein